MLKDADKEIEHSRQERVIRLDKYLSQTKDPRDIAFMVRVANKCKERMHTPLKIKNSDETPQETIQNDPPNPINTNLFPTMVKDIPPEDKSASKPAATNTDSNKTPPLSTGKGDSNPSNVHSTSGSNGTNKGYPNPPPGGNNGGTNRPPPAPPPEGNTVFGGG